MRAGQKYTFTMKTAQRYIEKHGAAFEAALWDASRSAKSVADEYGYDYATVYKLRRTLVPDSHRSIRNHPVTGEMLRAFAGKATNRQLAKRFGIAYSTIEVMRRRHVGKRIKDPVKLTDSVMVLLRSSFSNERVAKALDVSGRTIWMLRTTMNIRAPKVRVVITEEQRAILDSTSNDKEAGEALGVKWSTAKYWRFLHREGLI